MGHQSWTPGLEEVATQTGHIKTQILMLFQQVNPHVLHQAGALLKRVTL